MPRLSERAVILENELTDETVELRTENFAHDIDHRGIFGQRFENRIAMEPEDLADVVFGVARERIRLLLGQHKCVRSVPSGRAQPADLDHSIVDRATTFKRHHPADDKEAVLIPFALL